MGQTSDYDSGKQYTMRLTVDLSHTNLAAAQYHARQRIYDEWERRTGHRH